MFERSRSLVRILAVGLTLILLTAGFLMVRRLWDAADGPARRAAPLTQAPSMPIPQTDRIESAGSSPMAYGPGGMAAGGSSGMGAPVTPLSSDPVVDLEIQFEDFEPRRAQALVVDSSPQRSDLLIPSEVLTPMVGKINGRIVTRVPQVLVLRTSGSMMPGYPMAANVVLGQPSSPLGLTAGHLSERLPSLKIRGDFASPRPGETLTVASSEPATRVTVVARDASITTPDGRILSHLLKLNEDAAPSGALLENAAGVPVAQVVLRSVPDEQGSVAYAVPLDRIFAEIDRSTVPSSPAGMTAAMPGASSATPADFPKAPAIDPDQPADALDPAVPADSPFQAYAVETHSSNAVEALQALYGHVARIAPGTDHRSVLVLAPRDVQERIAATITQINATERKQAEARMVEAKKAEKRIIEESIAAEEQMRKSFEDVAARDAADREAHRNEPRRTRIVPVTRRDPQEVARVLTELFGDQANVTVDTPTRSVLITINGAETWSEVQFLLAEVEATLKRLLDTPDSASSAVAAAPEIPPLSPEEAQLEQSARNLARQIRTAPADQQAALREQLRQTTDRQFSLRQKQRKQEFDDLTARITALREVHARRERAREEVIRRRIADLLDPNAELRWNGLAPVTPSTQSPASVARAAEPMRRSTDGAAADPAPAGAGSELSPATEKSFDGTPYSLWLRWLSTERKAEKLASAMDAASRLAEPADHARVAAMIFRAAAEFESSPRAEQIQITNAGWAALRRLNDPIVAEQLLIALRDPVYRGRRPFQVQLIPVGASDSLRAALQTRATEVIDELLKLARTEEDMADWCTAAACTLWGPTSRPLSDFPELARHVDSMLDRGTVRTDATALKPTRPEWRKVVEMVAGYAPDTPNLAMRLLAHANQDAELVAWIGHLGSRAEPAVPQLVDWFLQPWQILEDKRIADRFRRNDVAANPTNERELQFQLQILRTLGEIGRGARGYQLLHELTLITPDPRPWDPGYQIYSVARDSLKKFPEAPAGVSETPVLRDYSLLNGIWKLDSPTQDFGQMVIEDLRASYAPSPRSSSLITVGSFQLGSFLNLDLDASPRAITFWSNNKPTATGIYELTESKLRIQLYEGEVPAAVSNTPADVPAGQLLLEFTRTPRTPVDDTTGN